MNLPKSRTIIYVDGLNLYYGALKGTSYKWLDLEQLFKLLRNDDDIVSIKYFTTLVSGRESRVDQEVYLKALSALPLITIIEGRFKPKRIKCRVPGCQFTGNKEFVRLEEKQTDVNIAVKMLEDAYEDKCDQFVIISGDSDFVPALRSVKLHFPNKKIIVYVPAEHTDRSYATELKGAADKARNLPLNLLRRSQLPSTISDGSGGTIVKPADW